VDTINALQPDLVVFSGDLVNIRSTELTSDVLAILGRLRAPYGVISTLGNHDVGLYIKDTVALPRAENNRQVIDRQRQIGWRMLLDSTLYLRRGSDSISVTGISFDPTLQKFRHSFDLPEISLAAAYDGVPEGMFNLTVSHLPQLWPNIIALGRGNLTLAGHVHSMQIKGHLFGRAFSPAQLMYDRWSGRYDDAAGNTLYINDGIGYVGFPMRLGADPEITLFTLKK
jgi:predicted MPP superfamily phosphohydrolase